MKGKWFRKGICWMMAVVLLSGAPSNSLCLVWAQGEEEVLPSGAGLIEAPEGVLLEAKTGTLIYEKEKDQRRSPASITKIMTLILIFDALERGSLHMEDLVTTSANAKSMGGSQVFLEEGETQTVETMIKCIVIASGNDASVAMAEHISGSEQEFVKEMNARAAGLGMKNTHFEDCCGLTESENHYTTAYDVALMSRELITRYPGVLEYSSIWMETITHETRQGSKEFGLTNTNKLIRSYEGCLGLKTGSTSVAKYCLSAVAERDGITLISVVMAAPENKARFRDATAMLNYGFSKCSLYEDSEPQALPKLSVKKGKQKEVSLVYQHTFSHLSVDGSGHQEVERRLLLPKEAEAPVKKGETAGKMEYYMNGKLLGSVPILYGQSVLELSFSDCLEKALEKVFS